VICAAHSLRALQSTRFSCSHEGIGGHQTGEIGGLLTYGCESAWNEGLAKKECGRPGTPKLPWRLLLATPLQKDDRPAIQGCILFSHRSERSLRDASTDLSGVRLSMRLKARAPSRKEGRGLQRCRGDVSSTPGILFWSSPPGTSQTHSVTLIIQAKQLAGGGE